MKTKDLEKELGLTKHTIRYYEDEGFIHPQRDENGYRNYSEEDLQILQVVKFLRSLNISIDDIKAFLDGRTSFEECLGVTEIHLEKQVESLKKIQNKVKLFKEKNLPIIPALDTIESQTNKSILGIQKTTNTVSLGRKLTKQWAIRQLIYTLMASLFLSAGVLFWSFQIVKANFIIMFILFITLTVILMVVMIGLANRVTSSCMLDNSLDQSIEFLREEIRYYQFKGFQSNIKYFIAVILGKDEKYVHNYQYEDIDKVLIYTNRKYMDLGSRIAYEVYVPNFEFYFKDGEKFYFFWPMILDDDARYIAHILENKVKNIEDKDHILYAMKNGINMTDYMQSKQKEDLTQ